MPMTPRPHTLVHAKQQEHNASKQNHSPSFHKLGTILMICGAVVLAFTLLRPMLFGAWGSTGAQWSKLIPFDSPFVGESKPTVTQQVVVDNTVVTFGLRNDDENAHTIDITLTDANGQPVAARQAYLFLTMPGMLMGVDSIEAESKGVGHFVAEGSLFSMLGEWRVEASLERAPDDWVRAPIFVRVGNDGVIELVTPSDAASATSQAQR